jgi:hypothetical protein
MRWFSIGTLLVVIFAAAGCGGGGGGGGGNKPSGEAAKPAATVVADATKAAEAASSVHMSGQIATGGKQIGVDLSLARGKGATGTFTLGGSKVDLIVIGNKAYMRAGTDFWKQFSQASGFAQLLADKWLAFPSDNAQLGSLTQVANAQALFAQLTSSHGKLANRGATTYKGQSVVAIDDTTKHATLYVSASGTPYPVAIVKTTAGAVTFDRWNQPVALTAPKGALDFSQLGTG